MVMPRKFNCAIIAIGDELLMGKIQDSNSSFLAHLISEYGFHVLSMEIIGDEEPRMVAAMQSALEEADLLLITGGLGPTEDDRTRHALAAVTGTALQENKSAWRQITSYYNKNWPGRTMSASNKRQALMPRGTKILKNDRGTAPGMLAKVGEAYIACMPGVPHEMRAMADRLMGQLDDLFPDLHPPVCEEIHFAGLGESRAQDLLGDLLAGEKPQVGICAHEDGHITIRVRGSASAVKTRCSKIRKVLKHFLLPTSSLAESIVTTLSERGELLTTAESCTCGHIVAAIGAIPGASDVLHESMVAYHNDIKTQRLGVDPTLIKQHGVVSEQVVAAMAKGALDRTYANYAIVSSGIAGPGGGTKQKPVGTVWVAVASEDRVMTHRLSLRGDRSRIQRRSAAEALRLLWQLIIESE